MHKPDPFGILHTEERKRHDWTVIVCGAGMAVVAMMLIWPL